MKILIISAEVWKDNTNGGNVLSNLFNGINADFAQIYCNPGIPKNNICNLYYQMTDKMIIDGILKRKEIGKIFNIDKSYETINYKVDCRDYRNNKFMNFIKSNLLNSIKEISWNLSKWNNDKLDNFIKGFNPDIIFAPCYGSHFMLKLTRYVKKIAKVPVISYISDDHYSLKQYSFSPIYWINRVILRKNLRKTFKYYDLVYTMTEEQLNECKKAFNCNIKILKKGGSFNTNDLKKEKILNNPIKLVYAGGLYLNRWKTLEVIAKAIKKVNKNEKKFVMEIYSGNKLSKRQLKYINDGENSIFKGLVSQDELKDIYYNSDIALHVEGLDLKHKLTTRISFSTKIIDLLFSKCAVMVVAWNKHSGYTYLKKNNLAICIDKLNNIEKELDKIYNNKNIIIETMKRDLDYGIKNHNIDNIYKELINDFEILTNISKGKKDYINYENVTN